MCFLTVAARPAGAVAGTGEQRFSATLEQSRWDVRDARASCTLSHEIPRFGVARFEQRAGRRLEFSLFVSQPPVADQTAYMVSVPPDWKHGVGPRNLGGVALIAGQTPMRVPREKALRIWYELEQGMMPTLVFDDWGDGQDRVVVSLSPVRFRDALAEFSACTGRLLYLDFEPVSEDSVYFATNSVYLTPGARRDLDKVAARIRKHPSLRVVLGGHADERGADGYNMTLSRKRAQEVARYLRRRGVSGKLIETRHFGESQPANNASGRDAWAQNRRVTVWLAEQ
jgi:outer membrane protein OmpA-like peptidoglycan-associated protein